MKCTVCSYEGETLSKKHDLRHGEALIEYEKDDEIIFRIDMCPQCGVMQVIKEDEE